MKGSMDRMFDEMEMTDNGKTEKWGWWKVLAMRSKKKLQGKEEREYREGNGKEENIHWVAVLEALFA